MLGEDITPISLEETESHWFSTKRVFLPSDGIPDGLEYALTGLLEHELYGASLSRNNTQAFQKRLDSRLELFNKLDIDKYNQGQLCKANAGAIVDAHNTRLYVDYWGLYQDQADLLPAYLGTEIYNKYLNGFEKLKLESRRNPEILRRHVELIVKDVSRKYIRQRLDKQLYRDLQIALQHALHASELVTEVKTYSEDNKIAIECMSTSSTPEKLHLSLALS